MKISLTLTRSFLDNFNFCVHVIIVHLSTCNVIFSFHTKKCLLQMIQGETQTRKHMIFLSTIKLRLRDYDTSRENSKGSLTSRKLSIKVLKIRFESRYVWPLTCDVKKSQFPCFAFHGDFFA